MKLGIGLYRTMLNANELKFAKQVGATHIVAHMPGIATEKGAEMAAKYGKKLGHGYSAPDDPMWTYEGLRDLKVRNAHALPNALLPIVTLAAINLGYILSGAIAVEAVFSWPGLGQATANALQGPDFPMLQGLFLVFSASIIFFNFVSDVLYVYLDPRVEEV